MAKYNFEIEIKTVGFIQLDIPDDEVEDDMEDYAVDNHTEAELLEMLTDGKYATETVQTVSTLNHAKITEEL